MYSRKKNTNFFTFYTPTSHSPPSLTPSPHSLPPPNHRIRYTEGRLLGFSYDFGVTRNSSSNADAMVLASVRLRGIHPPDIIQNGGHPGGECLSNAHCLGPWRQHFDDESWRGSGYSSRPSVCLILCPNHPHPATTQSSVHVTVFFTL